MKITLKGRGSAWLVAFIECRGYSDFLVARPFPKSTREPSPADVDAMLREAGFELGPIGAASSDDYPMPVRYYRSATSDGEGRMGSQVCRARCRATRGAL